MGLKIQGQESEIIRRTCSKIKKQPSTRLPTTWSKIPAPLPLPIDPLYSVLPSPMLNSLLYLSISASATPPFPPICNKAHGASFRLQNYGHMYSPHQQATSRRSFVRRSQLSSLASKKQRKRMLPHTQRAPQWLLKDK